MEGFKNDNVQSQVCIQRYRLKARGKLNAVNVLYLHLIHCRSGCVLLVYTSWSLVRDTTTFPLYAPKLGGPQVSVSTRSRVPSADIQ